MAAKLDQTAESICCPKWAIARDMSITAPTQNSSTTKSVPTEARRWSGPLPS
ncbi:hypothetical protein DFH11DRAFT_1630323, partial [Phellopilus nigrolimitatus]